jgi:4-amino-4-deoxychorismate lyase
MTLAILINGAAPQDLSHALAANDRGFHYGDGVFETALLADGRVRFLDDHLQRLFDGCARLGIGAPDRASLVADIDRVTASLRSGVLKIIVSRGEGARGYRPAGGLQSARMVALYAAPEPPPADGISLRWCETRLARNTRLAGIKHLNRLEQVLAQAEWQDERIAEGLMLDTEGELVCATAANVFIVREGVLATPDLRFCGVRGVMRAQVLRAATQLGLVVTEEPLWPHDLQAASEVFVTNAVRGIRSAVALEALRWNATAVARKLTAALRL